jgi:hypothetical protein
LGRGGVRWAERVERRGVTRKGVVGSVDSWVEQREGWVKRWEG